MSTNTGNSPQPPEAAGVISRASPHSVNETLERLEGAVRARGIKVFAVVDHSGEAALAGLSMQPAKLLLFGAPKGVTPLMRAAPLLALDRPIKALVWQDATGTDWVSYNSTAYLATRHHIPDELAKNIAWIDLLVDGALHG